MLELKNIYKKYESKVVLDDVSLSMKKGEVAILLGRSGVGKSTLLRVLNGLDHFDSGEIFLKGKIGMVFQDFNLFRHLRVEENLTLPLILTLRKNKKEAKKIAQKLLESFNLLDLAKSFPSELSGGQKQRLAIARAVAMNPALLCLDEPTSALDPQTTHEVLEYIKLLSSQGYMILMTTHDMSILGKIDCTIYLMENGKIKEKVKSAEFFSNKDRYPSIVSHLR